ncbi:transducin beta-like protein 3 [Diaphorina citri]|uniref:Transducin beta-like protein 3 n=1 Tax=Diaphorina citri TaxID=121845 RepID=A0A3Q0IQE0_DIACI|nr:transducin beta-like protein 3 [Diaphorina citri]
MEPSTLEELLNVIKFHTNPDSGKLELFAAGDEYIAVYDVTSGDLLYKLTAHFNRITDFDFDLVNNRLVRNSDRTQIVSTGADGLLKLWSIKTSTCVSTFDKHALKIWTLAITKDENQIITGDIIQEDESQLKQCLTELHEDQKEELLKCAVTWNTNAKHAYAAQCDQIPHKSGLREARTVCCVWFVNFSPLDRILISSSGDATIKLWCLTDYVCLKSLEGHDASVLRCHFINKGTQIVRMIIRALDYQDSYAPGTQIVSTGADGLLKLWSIKTSTCVSTFDKHALKIRNSDRTQIVSTGADGLLKLWSIKTSTCVSTFDKHALKIWTLAITKDENQIITGGADSLLVTWRDATEETVSQRIAEAQQAVMQSQQLDNLINAKENVKALKLALKLNRPHTTLKIIQNIIQEDESQLKQCLTELHEDQKEELLKCAVTWNTNAKHAYAAQLVLSVLLELTSGGITSLVLSVLLELQCTMVSKSFQGSLEALLPYTQRHFARLMRPNQTVGLNSPSWTGVRKSG